MKTTLLMLFLIAIASCRSSEKAVIGMYHDGNPADNRSTTLTLIDTTFEYNQCVGKCWCLDEFVSKGTWEIKGNTLILNSYYQPSDSITLPDSGYQYQYFTNHSFQIEGTTLIDASAKEAKLKVFEKYEPAPDI